LGRQGKRSEFGHIGEQVRRILEPQAIVDQAMFAGKSDDVLKNLLEPLIAHTLAKMGAVGVIGQHGMQIEPKKSAEGHVGADAFDDLPIRQTIVKTEEQDLEHAYWIDGWAAHRATISVDQPTPKALKINHRANATKIMIFRHHDLEHLGIKLGQRLLFGYRQHRNYLAQRRRTQVHRSKPPDSQLPQLSQIPASTDFFSTLQSREREKEAVSFPAGPAASSPILPLGIKESVPPPATRHPSPILPPGIKEVVNPDGSKSYFFSGKDYWRELNEQKERERQARNAAESQKPQKGGQKPEK
jgi:hypothetical protein